MQEGKRHMACMSTSVAGRTREVPLYWLLVRPNLESWGQFWPLTTRKILRGWSVSRERNRGGEGAGTAGAFEGAGVAHPAEKEAWGGPSVSPQLPDRRGQPGRNWSGNKGQDERK